MQNIERRIAALEIKANAADGALKFVWMEQGETEADALKRAGYAPDATNVLCVMFGSPTDERL
jgi:hypothetical protein